MITDDQYRALENRVNELEKKLDVLAKKYSEQMFRSVTYDNHKLQQKSVIHRKKDTTRYIVNGNEVNKRELVYYCVSEFVKGNPKLTYEEVADIFPPYVQGSLGIVRKAFEAEKYERPNIRFWFADKKVIYIEKEPCVICKQWSIDNINRFIILARKLGYEISVVERKY